MERTDVRNRIKVPSGLRLKGIISKEAPEIVQVVCLEDCEIDAIDFEEDYKYYMTPPEAETLIQTGKFHAWNIGRWRIPGKNRNSKLA
jgi:hypothetical protein